MSANYMDVFLQKHGLTRYDVHKRTGISQQTLSNANKKLPEAYSGKILMSLSEATSLSPGKVLDQLLEIQIKDELYEVTDWETLKNAVENLYAVFYIKGPFMETVKEMKSEQLSEDELMGLELGTRGTAYITETVFSWLYRQFKVKDKEKDRIKHRVTIQYHIVVVDESTILLKRKNIG